MVDAVVFDFDGTLVDSVPSIWREYQRVMEVMNLKDVTHREFTKHVGRPWEQVLRSLWPDIDVLEFTKNYRSSDESLKPFKGVGKTFKYLSKKYKLAIMTSRGESSLVKNLKDPEINLKLFDGVFHRNNLRFHKPDPRAITQVCESLGVKPEDTIYVGDSIVDARCALDAGAGFIGVLSGGAWEEDMRGEGVKVVLESVVDLPNVL